MHLIVSDLDGTLVVNNHISKEIENSIKYWKKLGNEFWIATGRSFCESKRFLTQLNNEAPVILNNGTQIYDYQKKQSIVIDFIESKTAKSIFYELELMNNLNNLIVYTDKGNYGVCINEEFAQEIERWETNLEIKRNIYYWENQKILRILLFKPKEETFNLLKKYRLKLIENPNNTIDIMPLNADKGIALEKLLSSKKRSIGFEKIFVVGDGINDIPLKKHNNILIAVENAHQQLKNLCDIIGCSASQNIIEYIIKKIIKENKDMKSVIRDKHNYYLDIAETVSKRCTCLRRHYGAVIVKNDEIISTGYVGAPRGRKNCTDLGVCVREQNNIPRGERYELCRSVHAEANAIISASREEMLGSSIYLVGIETTNGDYVANANSCSMCKRLIINAGINKVYIRDNYNEYRVVEVEDWIKDDESLCCELGY